MNRTSGCHYRYSFFLLIGATLGVACGGDSGGGALGPPPPAGFDATGDWTYTEALSNNANHIRCNAHGILHISQSGTTLSGTIFQDLSCTGPGGSAQDTVTVPITAGSVGETDVALTVDVCQYTGTLYTSGTDVKGTGGVDCNIDLGGSVIHLGGTWDAIYRGDVTPPTATGTAAGPLEDTLLVPGDNLTVTVDGVDNLNLRWLGFSLDAPANIRDSARVTGTSANATIIVPVVNGWIGGSRFQVFARDSFGLLGGDPLENSRPFRYVRVADLARPPTIEIPVGGASTVQQVLEDVSRRVLYLSQPESYRVSRFDLGARSLMASIAMPSGPYGMDLTLGGDSLLVALRDADALGVVELQPATPAVSTIPLNFAPYDGGPDHIKIAANNRALISITGAPVSSGGRLMTLDLTNGNQQVRTDVGTFALISEIAPLIAGTSRSPVVAFTGPGCPCTAQLYLTATDFFAAPVPAGALLWPPPTIDTAGTRVLVGPVLFDGTLNQIDSLAPPGQYYWGVAALSPDGKTVAFATDEGFLLQRISDKAVLARYRTPIVPEQLQFLASERALLLWGGFAYGSGLNRVFLVTLP